MDIVVVEFAGHWGVGTKCNLANKARRRCLSAGRLLMPSRFSALVILAPIPRHNGAPNTMLLGFRARTTISTVIEPDLNPDGDRHREGICWTTGCCSLLQGR
jgi:hypothetical protein